MCVCVCVCVLKLFFCMNTPAYTHEKTRPLSTPGFASG